MYHQDSAGYPSPALRAAVAGTRQHVGPSAELFDREPLLQEGCLPQGFTNLDADVQGVGGLGGASFDLAGLGEEEEEEEEESSDNAGTALAAATNSFEDDQFYDDDVATAAATSSFEGLAMDGNDEQILIAAAVEHAAVAAQFENIAMLHDREGDAKEAIANYLLAAEKLKQAASLCPEGLPDKAVLSRHAGEVLGRVVYLESLNGAHPTAPLEQHIGRVILTLGAPQPEYAEEENEEAEAEALGFATLNESDVIMLADMDEGRPASVKKRAASAAVIAGGTGLAVLHAPLMAVGLAGAAAYAATRQDTAGRAARKVGDVGLQTASRAQTLAEEYRIPERINQTVGKVVNERHKEKAASAVESLKSFNRKHQVTNKIGQGTSAAASKVASATSSISSWVSNAVQRR